MLRLPIGFLAIALVTDDAGIGIVSSPFMQGAKILFFGLIILAFLSFVGAAYRRRARQKQTLERLSRALYFVSVNTEGGPFGKNGSLP
jgi:uncharacterized membrane protein YtjA (UPF0391 family)